MSPRLGLWTTDRSETAWTSRPGRWSTRRSRGKRNCPRSSVERAWQHAERLQCRNRAAVDLDARRRRVVLNSLVIVRQGGTHAALDARMQIDPSRQRVAGCPRKRPAERADGMEELADRRGFLRTGSPRVSVPGAGRRRLRSRGATQQHRENAAGPHRCPTSGDHSAHGYRLRLWNHMTVP
jgi:hypothetical protein